MRSLSTADPDFTEELGQFQARQAAVTSRIRLAGVFRPSSNMCTATVSGENAAADLVVQTRTLRAVATV